MVVVGISGMPGCGSSTAGRLLAKKLKIDFFSVGDYTKIEALKLVGEPEETKRAAEFWYSEKGSSKEFHNRSDEMQIEIAKKGDVVIDAKLAVHMLKGIADLRVWIASPFETRAQHVAKRDRIKLDDAKDVLKEKENLERENFKKIYGFDYFTQDKEADLVVEAFGKNPDQIVDAILKELKNRGKA